MTALRGASRRLLLACCWLAAVGVPSAAVDVRAQTIPPAESLPAAVNPQHEYNVKAAFLYSFGRYVEWPPSVFSGGDAPFVIGVLGEDPFGGALDKIAQSKQIQRRPIVVHRFASLEEYRPCQILFISRTTSPEEQAAAIEKLSAKPVLLLGDEIGFARRGGTFSFYLEGDTVRFEINIDCVKRQRLSVDAKLLKLATMARKPTTPPDNRS